MYQFLIIALSYLLLRALDQIILLRYLRVTIIFCLKYRMINSLILSFVKSVRRGVSVLNGEAAIAFLSFVDLDFFILVLYFLQGLKCGIYAHQAIYYKFAIPNSTNLTFKCHLGRIFLKSFLALYADREIKIKSQRLEEVENFKYLGAIISNDGSKSEILSRIAQTTAALSRLKIIRRDKNISLLLRLS